MAKNTIAACDAARRTEAAERENALLKRALEQLTKTLAEKDTP